MINEEMFRVAGDIAKLVDGMSSERVKRVVLAALEFSGHGGVVVDPETFRVKTISQKLGSEVEKPAEWP